MDLSYPPAVRDSLDRIGQALTDVSIKDELAACESEPDLWNKQDTKKYEPAASPLAQVAEFRALGFYALPLPELLARTKRAYLPLPAKWSAGGATALGWPDASGPWAPGEPLSLELDAAGKLQGRVSVSPFCVPARALLALAGRGGDVALVECWPDGSRAERLGDAFVATFEGTQARVLAESAEALSGWERAVTYERLALIGLTAGVIDRAWRIALDALCEGKRQGQLLADEQVAQFQLADNDIERLSAEHLVLDVAIAAERGKPFNEKLALVRYFTSKQAEACAGRALHLSQLFLPRVVPIARWLSQRAHHLSVFGMAREHEVRLATAGLVAGMSLE